MSVLHVSYSNNLHDSLLCSLLFCMGRERHLGHRRLHITERTRRVQSKSHLTLSLWMERFNPHFITPRNYAMRSTVSVSKRKEQRKGKKQESISPPVKGKKKKKYLGDPPIQCQSTDLMPRSRCSPKHQVPKDTLSDSGAKDQDGRIENGGVFVRYHSREVSLSDGCVGKVVK